MLGAIGAEVVVAGETFRFGHRRRGDLALLARLGFDARAVPFLDGVSSTEIRACCTRATWPERPPCSAGRPRSRARSSSATSAGGTLGFPTANLAVEPQLLVPPSASTPASALGTPAAISIGTNPHYGGPERRIEAFLLDFEGDLYGQRLVVELWQRLRDERAFESEQALIDQIARDVEATRRPSDLPDLSRRP